jgi:transposase
MSKQTVYIGVDVGKDELWAVIDGKKPRMFKHTANGIRSLHRWVAKGREASLLHFCMEATGVYSNKLAVRLNQYDNTVVSIVNPAQISSYGQAQLRRTKNDRVDARVILSFAQTQHPSTWSPPDGQKEQLYLLQCHADALKDDLQQWNNRAHAHQYRSKGQTRTVRASGNRVQNALKRELARIEQAIEELINSCDQLSFERELLCSIPGVAELSAAKILAYGRDCLTTRNRNQLTAHAGLSPKECSSGSSVRGKPYIIKKGDRRLRTALFMPALVGTRYNPIMKKHYQRLLDKGKLKKVALVACMKKLLLIIRAILMKKQPFDAALNNLT